MNVGDRFLVERGTYSNPLATYQVTVAYHEKDPYVLGHATRVGSPYNPTLPSVNDPGRVYWKMIPHIADGFTSGQLESHDLADSPQLVEILLIAQRVHRMPKTIVTKCLKFPLARQSFERCALPYCVVPLYIFEDLR